MKETICLTATLIFFWCCHASAYDRPSTNDKIEAGAATVEMLADAINGYFENENFRFDINTGLDLSFWKPGFDDDKVVKFSTEGIKTYHVGTNFAYRGKTLLGLRYERPVDETNKQEEILSVNTSQKAGLEKFIGGVKLDSLADLLFPDNMLLKKIFSVEYRYTKECFFGEVTAQRNLEYLPKDAVVDPVKRIIAGSVPVSAGETLAFRTEFINQEISLPLISMNMQKTINYNGRVEEVSYFREDLRAGYFNFKWNRPSHGTYDTLAGKPIISDTTFNAQGIFLAFETQDPDAPGLNLDWVVRNGLSGEVDNAFHYKKSDVTFAGISINSWYNHYFSGRRDRFAATIGFLFDWRRINIDVNGPETSTSTDRVLEEQEKLYKVYLNLLYRF